MLNQEQFLLAIAKDGPSSELDDNLLAAYIEDALTTEQRKEVSLLLAQKSSWRQRWIYLKSLNDAKQKNSHINWKSASAFAASILVISGVWIFQDTPSVIEQQIVITESINKTKTLAYQGVQPNQWHIFITYIEDNHGLDLELQTNQVLFKELANGYKGDCQNESIEQLLEKFKSRYPAEFKAILNLSKYKSNGCDLKDAMTQFAKMAVSKTTN